MNGRIHVGINTKTFLELDKSTSTCPTKDSPWIDLILLLPKITSKYRTKNEFEEEYSAFGVQFHTGFMWNGSSYFWGVTVQVLGVGFKVTMQTGY